ncbi:hypothetical protein SAMN06265784_10644 [Paraburkholderia susongensis]|uniref:Uncharacterized protein n=1 Tax=Paraburkholderia susongensis TaxID=1515439 RepID=A0A1X7LG29_9BURK|nr:hypothetical protein SAMN06265784_10644 [Paraburkholderia susongensis]
MFEFVARKLQQAFDLIPNIAARMAASPALILEAGFTRSRYSRSSR